MIHVPKPEVETNRKESDDEEIAAANEVIRRLHGQCDVGSGIGVIKIKVHYEIDVIDICSSAHHGCTRGDEIPPGSTADAIIVGGNPAMRLPAVHAKR